ncbi:3-hydroxyanthranilic acid dioxygenase [Epichloe bromicola]
MTLRVSDHDGVFRDVTIREGDMFLLPPGVPHSPVRFANTVGVVVEQRRPAGSLDRMRWYCASCPGAVVVHEAAFCCTDLGTQVADAVNDFKTDDEKRRCAACGELADWAPEPGSISDPNLASNGTRTTSAEK